jgi:hypothetical protein
MASKQRSKNLRLAMSSFDPSTMIMVSSVIRILEVGDPSSRNKVPYHPRYVAKILAFSNYFCQGVNCRIKE